MSADHEAQPARRTHVAGDADEVDGGDGQDEDDDVRPRARHGEGRPGARPAPIRPATPARRGQSARPAGPWERSVGGPRRGGAATG